MKAAKLVQLFEEKPFPGVLCSSDGQGDVNAAIFGSVRLLDDRTLVVGLGDNRTVENLRVNPKATYVFFAPDPNILAWQGARLYLEAVGFEDSGPVYTETVACAAKAAGKNAAAMLKTAVVFRIERIRPLVDLGR